MPANSSSPIADELAAIAQTLKLLEEEQRRHCETMSEEIRKLTDRIYTLRGVVKRAKDKK